MEDIRFAALSVYPNPSEGELNLNHLPEGKNLLRLFDPLGKEVLREESGDGYHRLDLSDLKAGYYLLLIQNASAVWEEKIIVK